MKLFSRAGMTGDAPIAELEGIGGRPFIAGDPEVTQENLMLVVRGDYKVTRAENESAPCIANIGKMIIKSIKH